MGGASRVLYITSPCLSTATLMQAVGGVMQISKFHDGLVGWGSGWSNTGCICMQTGQGPSHMWRWVLVSQRTKVQWRKRGGSGTTSSIQGSSGLVLGMSYANIKFPWWVAISLEKWVFLERLYSHADLLRYLPHVMLSLHVSKNWSPINQKGCSGLVLWGNYANTIPLWVGISLGEP